MIETKDLILDKAKFSDWEGMYRNVWSWPEITKYMEWRITTNEDDAKIRIQKTIEFQKTHDTYLVYEKASGMPIGFAGVEMLEPFVCQETGICLGPKFVKKRIRETNSSGFDSILSKRIWGKRIFLFNERRKYSIKKIS